MRIRWSSHALRSLLLAGALLQAACAPAAPPTPAAKATEPTKPAAAQATAPAQAAPAKPAEAVKPTGTFKVALNGEPPTLDPAVANDLSSSPLSWNLYTTLVTTDASGKLVPSLAESWTTSQDGTTFTFKLRANAKFHNGDKIEAKDVKWSWERALNPATKSPTARDTLGDIVGGKDILDGKATELNGVRVVDPTTLEVKVSLPMRGDLLTNATGWATSVVYRPTVEGQGERWFE